MCKAHALLPTVLQPTTSLKLLVPAHAILGNSYSEVNVSVKPSQAGNYLFFPSYEFPKPPEHSSMTLNIRCSNSVSLKYTDHILFIFSPVPLLVLAR